MMGKDRQQTHGSFNSFDEKDDDNRHELDRREVMQLSVALGASAALSGSALFAGWPKAAEAATTVNVELKVSQVGGDMTYNGKTPGPTIAANAGDTIDIHLVNNLPKKDDDCVPDHNEPHGGNTTNLHTHGLHVSPYKDSRGMYDADNIFLKVVPKNQTVPCWDDETFRAYETKYRFELPADHPPGTHWYHAHKHGSTDLQVFLGLAGPLIVKDPAGSMPSYIENAEEKTFMINGKFDVVLVDPKGGGEIGSTIKLRPGEVQRWRIINASPDANAFVHLSVDAPEVELWQIAFDGLTLPRRVKVDPENNKEPWLNSAALAPGNRTDFMIHVPKDTPSKTVSFVAATAPLEFLHSSSRVADADPAKITIEIEGEPVDHEWSTNDDLPGSGLTPIEGDSLPTRSVTFGNKVIDGEAYSGQVRQTMTLGTSEEWTVSNTTRGTHPFHIHVNPFFVTHIDGVELAEDSPLRRWQDTIALPGGSEAMPGSVTFRSRFVDFSGKFVIHCHILDHEDRGMMQAVEVV